MRRRDEVMTQLSGFVKPLLVMSVMIMLLLLEPDFGTVVVVLGTILGMLFLGGVKAGQFFLAILAASGAITLMVLSQSYRVQRVLAFLDPLVSGERLWQRLSTDPVADRLWPR